MQNIPNESPEIWGGLECTINRVDDLYIDQLQLSGFYESADQMNAIVDLGIKAMRFPVLWERHQPVKNGKANFSWALQNLETLRQNNIEPIVGLLHHGSGPAYTDLLSDDFPGLFAKYASLVARQMPWIKYYIPVNEPLTTARFSGLYGIWYPHEKNEFSFFNMLLNELKATVLGMREIRKVNPAAVFIQTEDLGKTYSTPKLSYQASFENHRRWLTYDFLCGRVNEEHPLWNHILSTGIDKCLLKFFYENPCPPDMIGVNHYITSERFLDDSIEKYPAEKVGGNGIHRYADIEATRIRMAEPHGLECLLNEIWQRYEIPLVITEVHLHCTREEQVRWLKYVYDITVKLKRSGVNILAMTAWALTGSFGWNRLLTAPEGTYETGAFDISSGSIRPTAVASMVRKLCAGQSPGHPLLQKAGWWASPYRFYEQETSCRDDWCNKKVKPVLIIGKTGTLGNAFARICKARNIPFFLAGREDVDISSKVSIANVIEQIHPWAIINAAGYVKLDEAEIQNELCMRGNYEGVKNLAALCKQHSVKLLTFSSDQVFDGNKNYPYTEDDTTGAINTYGRSKQLAETYLSRNCPDALIIRTAAFFGPWDSHNFVYHLLNNVGRGENFFATDENKISPTYVPHLVNASLDLLIDEASGVFHLANKGNLSWYNFALMVLRAAGLKENLVIPGNDLSARAQRPRLSSLQSSKYGLMPPIEDAIAEYLANTEFKFHKSNAEELYERV